MGDRVPWGGRTQHRRRAKGGRSHAQRMGSRTGAYALRTRAYAAKGGGQRLPKKLRSTRGSATGAGRLGTALCSTDEGLMLNGRGSHAQRTRVSCLTDEGLMLNGRGSHAQRTRVSCSTDESLMLNGQGSYAQRTGVSCSTDEAGFTETGHGRARATAHGRADARATSAKRRGHNYVTTAMVAQNS